MAVDRPFMGIEIGGTKLQIVTGTAEGKILTRHRFQVDKEEGAAGIKSKIEQTIAGNYRKNIQSVGIGFGGPVNWRTGQVATSFHVEGWSDFNLIEWLSPIVEAPVFLDNDANVAAFGEAMIGAGRGYKLVLYITIGSGIGGGLIIDQEIYHGAIPGEVEIGHLQINRMGETFQDLCSGWGIDERIRKQIQADPSAALARLVGNQQSGEAKFLKAAIDEGDRGAVALYQEIINDIAFGLSHAIHLFHPDIVVIGGGFSLVGESLETGLQQQLPAYLMKAFCPGPVIRLAGLKEDSVPVGALLLAAERTSKK